MQEDCIFPDYFLMSKSSVLYDTDIFEYLVATPMQLPCLMRDYNFFTFLMAFLV